MNSSERNSITTLLESWRRGNRESGEKVMFRIYPELRKIAHGYLRKDGQALNTEELVHEAFLRLVRQDEITWQNRAHFYGFAAHLMKQILVEHARSQLREKRGAGVPDLPLGEHLKITMEQPAMIVALDDALTELETINRRQFQVVEMRFFGGMNLPDIADALDISVGTVKRDWNLARAWLFHCLTSKGKRNAG